jgi:uncharacterized membrane protein
MNPSPWALPPMPTLETAHPLVVHLPIGILAAVPLLAVWAMLAGSNRRTVGWAVMLLLLMGTTGAVMAAFTGEKAMEVAEATNGPAAKLLDEHEDMAELARNCFLGVSGAYAVITILSTILKDRIKRPIWMLVHAAWLLGFFAAFLVLANAGHMGGRLVHEFGVRAPMGGK